MTMTMTATRTRPTRSEAPVRPIDQRFPALEGIPRVRLVERATPVERSDLAVGLWVKREDLASDLLGGNKVRSLEYLLGPVRRGDRVLTVGARGSTHALATIRFAHKLGATAEVIRWPQEMNDCARRMEMLIGRESDLNHDAMHPVSAYARVMLRRAAAAARRRAEALHWVPAGGSSPLGVLGHVNAALELATQIEEGELPRPSRVVVALGSGGTAAGLALGLAIARIDARVIAVRVVPRVIGNRHTVSRLARGAARLIERVTGERPDEARAESLVVDHSEYGGAYGRESAGGRDAAARFAAMHGRRVEPTYTAKALAAALSAADGEPTVFWSTFDARCLVEDAESPHDGAHLRERE
jgi:1-aminocyclopropane-1-carboxylate deaminase/D-cysteine desulfhydrase-like pyridoxal-dependent ACC family enzyme